MQCRPLFAISWTTAEYSETLTFSMLYLCCHNTLHCYLYIGSHLAPAFLFQKTLLCPVSSNLFNKLISFLYPQHHHYTEQHHKLHSCIPLNNHFGKTNEYKDFYSGFCLIHSGKSSTFLRKNRQSLNVFFDSFQKRDDNNKA